MKLHIVTGKNHYVSMHLLLCFFFCSSIVQIFPQTQKTWQWIEQVGGDSWDFSTGLACDSKNNIYMTGNFSRTLFIGQKEIKSHGNQDGFIAKFKDDGTLLDIYNIGGKGKDNITCINISDNDKVIIGGLLSDTVILGKKELPEKNARLFISSLDIKGNFNWVTTIHFEGEALLFYTEVEKAGFIYAAGIYNGKLKAENISISSKGGKDIFIARLTPSGVVEKLETFGGNSDDQLQSITVDLSGNIIMSCTVGKPDEIFGSNTGRIPTEAKVSSYMVKFDRNLQIKWAIPYFSNEYLNFCSVKSDNNGNIYATGSYSSKLFLPDTVLITEGYTDGFIIKLFEDGNIQWIRSIGTWYYDYFNHLNIDINNGAIISGSIGDTLIIDSLRIEPEFQSNSAIILQISSEGEAIWADFVSGESRNFSNESLLDKKGNMYFTGSFRGTIEKGQITLSSYGDQDIFIGKYFNCPEIKPVINGDPFFCTGAYTVLSVKKTFTKVIWNDTILNKYSIIIDKPGNNKVTVTDRKGCVHSDSINITEYQLPYFTLGQDTTLGLKDSLLLKAPDNFKSYIWNDFSSKNYYLAKTLNEQPGTYEYWLTVTDSLECIYTDTIKITFLDKNYSFGISPGKLVVYPNPANDRILWYFFTEEPIDLIVELSDDQGKKYYRQLIYRYFPGEEREIDIKKLKSGVYNLKIMNRIKTDSYVVTRVVKQ
ncbi:MAG: T9SS type A sorting domain-containing protein [Bacteroidales bacterium]